MKTLDELVKELGLKPREAEITMRTGNYVYIFDDNTYITSCSSKPISRRTVKVIEVKPE